MNKTIKYKLQWLFDSELGTWGDAPFIEPEDELSANRLFNLVTKKHPTISWRVVRVTTEIIRDK